MAGNTVEAFQRKLRKQQRLGDATDMAEYLNSFCFFPVFFFVCVECIELFVKTLGQTSDCENSSAPVTVDCEQYSLEVLHCVHQTWSFRNQPDVLLAHSDTVVTGCCSVICFLLLDVGFGEGIQDISIQHHHRRLGHLLHLDSHQNRRRLRSVLGSCKR